MLKRIGHNYERAEEHEEILQSIVTYADFE